MIKFESQHFQKLTFQQKQIDQLLIPVNSGDSYHNYD